MFTSWTVFSRGSSFYIWFTTLWVIRLWGMIWVIFIVWGRGRGSGFLLPILSFAAIGRLLLSLSCTSSRRLWWIATTLLWVVVFRFLALFRGLMFRSSLFSLRLLNKLFWWFRLTSSLLLRLLFNYRLILSFLWLSFTWHDLSFRLFFPSLMQLFSL